MRLEEQLLQEDRNFVEEVTFIVKEASDGHIRIEPLEDVESFIEQETFNSDPGVPIDNDDVDFNGTDEKSKYKVISML